MGFAGAPRGGPPAEYSVEIGPSIFWQGLGLLAMDGRGSKDAKGMGAFPALFMSDTIMALNQVIQPAGLALSQAANPASGVSLPLTPTYAAGRGPGAPYAGALGVAIEPGFAVVGVTSASGNVSVQANDKWRFWPGQFLSIAGAGLGGAMLMTQVHLPSGPATPSPFRRRRRTAPALLRRACSPATPAATASSCRSTMGR